MTRLTLTLLLAGGVGCNANTSSQEVKPPSKESIRRAHVEYRACLILAGEDPDGIVMGEIYWGGVDFGEGLKVPPGGGMTIELSTTNMIPATVLNRARELDANQEGGAK